MVYTFSETWVNVWFVMMCWHKNNFWKIFFHWKMIIWGILEPLLPSVSWSAEDFEGRFNWWCATNPSQSWRHYYCKFCKNSDVSVILDKFIILMTLVHKCWWLLFVQNPLFIFTIVQLKLGYYTNMILFPIDEKMTSWFNTTQMILNLKRNYLQLVFFSVEVYDSDPGHWYQMQLLVSLGFLYPVCLQQNLSKNYLNLFTTSFLPTLL